MATQFAHAVDRILLHDYVTTEGALFPYITQRLQYLATGPDPTQVAVIFSAESAFLGPYLQTHSITQPFAVVDQLFNDIDAAWTANIDLIGSQWFAYSFMPQDPVHIGSLHETEGPEIYPNPSEGRIMIMGEAEEPFSYTLSDFDGRALTSGKGHFGLDGRFELNLDDLPDGVYFLRLSANYGQVVTHKVLFRG